MSGIDNFIKKVIGPQGQAFPDYEANNVMWLVDGDYVSTRGDFTGFVISFLIESTYYHFVAVTDFLFPVHCQSPHPRCSRRL